MIRIVILIIFASSVLISKPLYEFGAGFVGFHSPHYPGSEQREFRSAFLPLFIYRGETIYADEKGIKGDLSKGKWYEIDLSMAAAFPASSKNNKAREGMDDLDWLIEFGPSFEVHLLKSKLTSVDLRLQTRAIFSTDFSDITHRGYAAHLMFFYKREKVLIEELSGIFRAGTIYGSKKVMNYFYGVEAKDVTATRPEYEAEAGYLESHLDLGFIYDTGDRWRYFLGFQKNMYENAKNLKSPLHTTNQSYSIGIGVTWIFFKSTEQEKRKK